MINNIFYAIIILTLGFSSVYHSNLANELETTIDEQKIEITKLNKEIDTLSKKSYLYDPKYVVPRMIKKLKPDLDPVVIPIITQAVIEYGEEYGIHPALIVGQIMRESSFNMVAKGPLLSSGVRCIGLMQIHPYWQKNRLKKFGYQENSLSFIGPNIHVGVDQLKTFIKKEGSIKKALLRYVGETTPGSSGRYVEDILSLFAEGLLWTPSMNF